MSYSCLSVALSMGWDQLNFSAEHLAGSRDIAATLGPLPAGEIQLYVSDLESGSD